MTITLIVSLLFIAFGALAFFASSTVLGEILSAVFIAAGFISFTIFLCADRLLKELKKLSDNSPGKQITMQEAVAKRQETLPARSEEEFRDS